MRVRIMTNARPLGERRSGGSVDAPRKHHRTPPPTVRGAKKSDQAIAKVRSAAIWRRSPQKNG